MREPYTEVCPNQGKSQRSDSNRQPLVYRTTRSACEIQKKATTYAGPRNRLGGLLGDRPSRHRSTLRIKEAIKVAYPEHSTKVVPYQGEKARLRAIAGWCASCIQAIEAFSPRHTGFCLFLSLASSRTDNKNSLVPQPDLAMRANMTDQARRFGPPTWSFRQNQASGADKRLLPERHGHERKGGIL